MNSKNKLVPSSKLAWHSQYREQRFSRSPYIKDGYSWFLGQKAHMIEAAFWYIQASNISGDYLEFGIFEGMTFIQAWYAAQHLELNMRFHAFDSFCGLPPLTDKEDKDGPYHEGMFAEGTREVFNENLRRNNVDLSRVTVTEGFFENTLNSQQRMAIGLDSAAIIYIDCDLYRSTILALEFVSNVIVDGGVLIFDDWFAFRGRPDRGEQRAFEEWRSNHPEMRFWEYQNFGHLGKSFIVGRGNGQ